MLDRKTLIARAKTALSMVSEVADVAVHLRKPSIVGLSLVAAKAIQSYQKLTEDSRETFFDDWKNITFHPLDGLIYEMLSHQDRLTTKEETSKNQGKIVTANINGLELGWTLFDGWKEGPRILQEKDSLFALRTMAQFLWENIGQNIKLESNPVTKSLSLTQDVLSEALPSKTADDIYERLNRFVSHGHHRAALIYGEPGTGKSHIMRHVARRFGGLTLRIQASSLKSANHLAKIIKILQPNALLIDDLDRVSDSGIMEVFEEIKETVRVLIVSVNDFGPLDPATLRVGRFDEIFKIQKLDDGVLSHLLEGVPDHIATQLRELPVTYIAEYRKTLDVFGSECDALVEVQRLVERTETVRKLMKKKKTTPQECPEDEPADMTSKAED